MALVAALLLIAGCTSTPPAYYERYELRNLTVVLLDPPALRERYEAMYGKPALMLEHQDGGMGLKTVRGFFDYRTKTIYCSKLDFAVCGHELHHALMGRFHGE
ncbi:hypothetical protein [Candidatus Nitrospira bockiana]